MKLHKRNDGKLYYFEREINTSNGTLTLKGVRDKGDEHYSVISFIKETEEIIDLTRIHKNLIEELFNDT